MPDRDGCLHLDPHRVGGVPGGLTGGRQRGPDVAARRWSLAAEEALLTEVHLGGPRVLGGARGVVPGALASRGVVMGQGVWCWAAGIVDHGRIYRGP